MVKFRKITKNIVKSVKVNSVELKKINSAAKKIGMGFSTFLRLAALEKVNKDS